MRSLALPCLLLAAAAAAQAQTRAAAPPPEAAAAEPRADRAELDRTQIIGNRELPKVLYIVPWKKPLAGDTVGRPPASVVDEALAPLDRDVFRRQLAYDAQLRPAAAADLPKKP